MFDTRTQIWEIKIAQFGTKSTSYEINKLKFPTKDQLSTD